MKVKEILNKSKVIGLTLLNDLEEEDNVNSRQKLNYIDSMKYKYSYDYNQINDLYKKRYKKSIVNSSNPFTIDNIQQFIINNGSKTKVLSKEWTKKNEKLKLQCECGNIYEARWYHIYNNHKFQCNKCGYSNPYNKKSLEESEKICIKHKYHIIKDTYRNRKRFDMYDEFGYKYSNCSIYNLNKRTNKTTRFSYDNKYQIENILLYIKINNLPIKFVNKNIENVKKNDYIECICSECGAIYKATWEQLQINNRNCSRVRCERCTKVKSNLEFLVEEYLKEKNINYIYQKRFNDCKNKRCLPFDFYLPDYKCCIECQGSQHYYENECFEQTLEERQRIDKIKKEYCNKKNIKFIAIPFWLITQQKTQAYKKIIDNIIS